MPMRNILQLSELASHLSLTPDQAADGETLMLMQGKLDAAQQHLERLLGFRILDRFGGEGQEEVPPSLKEAVCQLAAWWFEQREAGLIGSNASLAPVSMAEIVREFREFTF